MPDAPKSGRAARAGLKVVPIDLRAVERERLIRAVGRELARAGFRGLTPQGVAEAAGTPLRALYRQFGGLSGLVAAFARSGEFWPPAAELAEDGAEVLRGLPPDRLMAAFFKRLLAALLRRPQTLAILAWEEVERHALAEELEWPRARCALEFFELMEQDPPEDVDLTALVLVLAGAVHFLAVRSRVHCSLGGVDLHSETGWARIEGILDRTLAAVLGSGRGGPGNGA
ncbi:MAG: TetR/AcrR family transcriptional regulator [Desulfovibrionaceae bacterium]